MYNTRFHTGNLEEFNILITGGAGFIGSHLVEYMIKHNARLVRVLDNFSTGSKANIQPFMTHSNFELIEGDIRDRDVCAEACKDIDFVFHQAALGSVPRSINDPITTNDVNVGGFVNVLYAAQQAKVKKVIYAASSSTYGDNKQLPKIENRIGKPLSPYAVTKLVNEIYAEVFSRVYNLKSTGLRYFNVFGPRQSPQGEYAAVIPLFIEAITNGNAPYINGDGEQTRDFTFVANVVQANLKAMLNEPSDGASHSVYNVACGQQISLNGIWEMLNKLTNKDIRPLYREARQGDIRDSLADISKISTDLGYKPTVYFEEGLRILLNYKQTGG